MTRPAPQPPAAARRALEWAAARLVTPDLPDDARDLFFEMVRDRGARAARRWYRRQARAAVGRVLWPRRLSRPRMPGLLLDAKLAGRMLIRYPGLTVVAGLALAFAIFVGAATFEIVNKMLDPVLPLPGGSRIVGLRFWTQPDNKVAYPRLGDVRAWQQLKTVSDVGAFQTVEQYLDGAAGAGGPVQLARMSAVGFRVAGAAPVIGRVLLPSDEEPGAPQVLVIGHRLWRERFGGAHTILGQTLRLGGAPVTVVGVMPDGFAFPRDHNAWTPLALAESTAADEVRAFGRLAPGATMEQARAEAASLRIRAPASPSGPAVEETVQVLPYAHALFSLRIGLGLRAMIYQVNVYAALFLILVASNVALLMFARVATREREIVVRQALGASRGRIVTQLFIEALVLGSVATMLGLAATGPGLVWILDELRAIGGEFPFWVTPALSTQTAVYAGLLTLLGAVIAGVVPAVRVTRVTRGAGGGISHGLQHAGAPAGRVRLGGIWTAVIVAQVAATVVFTGGAFVVARQAVRSISVDTHFPAGQYLGAHLEMDRAADAFELKRRLTAHAGVAGVTLTDLSPVRPHSSSMIEVEGGARHNILSSAVDQDFFPVFRAPVLAGRIFDSRDAARDVKTVVVDASFVEVVFDGGSAVGRRLRYIDTAHPDAPGPWHEIVGVIGDLVAERTESLDLQDTPRGRVYRALERRPAPTALVIVAHVPAGVEPLSAALHTIAAGVSPELRLRDPEALDRPDAGMAHLWRLYATLVAGISSIALFLSLAGIYAVMAFTVARRTREIGVRVALGASAARVVRDIFAAPLRQVLGGVSLGCVLVGATVWMLTGGRATLADGGLLLVFGLLMTAICALACVGPTLRALRVAPAAALSADK